MKKGLPLRLVERYEPSSGIWHGRRKKGNSIAAGHYHFGGPSLAEIRLVLPEESAEEAQLTAHICERALHLVLKRFEAHPELKKLADQLAGRTARVNFVRGHDLLLDLDSSAQTIYLACDLTDPLELRFDHAKHDLEAIKKPEILRGFELVLALGQVYIFQLLIDRSQRLALHQLVSFYQDFSWSERSYLHQVLEGTNLDSGNLFSLFLKKASFPTDSKPASAERWRDQQITWLLGQDRVDIPYDRHSAGEILRSEGDADEKRFRLYEVLNAYEPDLERQNIERLTGEIRSAHQQLIFGRMSRAFHNQATLLANAVLLCPGPQLHRLASELASIAEESEDLQSTAAELRLLAESNGEIPLTQIEGACERFEEAVLEVQKGEMLSFLERVRERVADHADTLSADSLPQLRETDIAATTAKRLHLVEAIRRELLKAEKRHAAYVVISQRPSPTGSHLLIKINEFEDPYLGKSENLRKLVRLAGDYVYSSPDYHWLEVADHWIEAIPLFIKEQIMIEEGRENTRTVIDIAAMEESFREEMADLWARNIRQVLEGDFLALAREIIATEDEGESQTPDPEAIGADSTPHETNLAALGILVGQIYRLQVEPICDLVEREDGTPYEALRRIVIENDCEYLDRILNLFRETGSWIQAVRQLLGQLGFSQDFATELERLCPLALQPQRSLPTLHVLTTQSAGMTEGYIRTWLEESMTLYNIVADKGLQQEVSARREFYAARIHSLGEKVIRELGIWVEVEDVITREQLDVAAAVQRVVDSNRSVQRELACLGILLEWEESECGRREASDDREPQTVADYLGSHCNELETEALTQVVERNGETLQRDLAAHRARHPDATEEESLRQLIMQDEHYREDLATYSRFAARHKVLEQLSEAHPQLHLRERTRTYLRRYKKLARTTARREIIAQKDLNHLCLHPFYYYQASGGGKRYHLLYTPSRVDLGPRERESVETWPQWVGGADRAAARVGRQLYGLINKAVCSYDSLTHPELLKTGENASMASHFAFSNSLSLMVNASRYGDIEEMGDQMSRRGDRIIHPAGEGYGGYCVPKDGLFLEFVLTLTRAEKLDQIGVPEEARHTVAELARELLDARPHYATQLEWETWGAARLQELGNSEVPLFQVTRIAQVLENLGQPELRDPYRIATNLAAHWGIHKMVAGGEHVNRFMPFFKSWLIRQGLAEAAGRHPNLPIASRHFTAVLTAEYKPDTQDGRFSAGMRKFEILAGTGDHLLHSLDAESQELALLIHQGYAALEGRGRGDLVLKLLGIEQNDAALVEQVRQLFPDGEPAAALRMVSPTGLSTQDLLNYTSDTRLSDLAAEGRRQLLAAGLRETEIEANMHVHGPRLPEWSHQVHLTRSDKESLGAKLGGLLHALFLEIVGPELSYERALQGADVLDTGIPHRILLDLLEDPARVCNLMLSGNPHSALVIVDGASGARRRAMNRLDVMLWFAAGERLDRQTVYSCIGLGKETVEAWRLEMQRQRRRAEQLGQALIARNGAQARGLYDRLVEDIRAEQQVQLHLGEIEKLRRFGRERQRDLQIAQSLARIGRGLPLKELGFVDFLALGGLFLLDGAPQEEIAAYQDSFAAGIEYLGGPKAAHSAVPTSLLHGLYRPEPTEFRQEKGLESSNKAAEEQVAVALEARRQLADRIVRARALNQRQEAFDQVASDPISFAAAADAARAALGSGDRPLSQSAFGTFAAQTRNALLALASQLHDADAPATTQLFIDHLSQLFSGRSIDIQVWHEISGGYEDIGDFGRLAQQVAEAQQQNRIDATEGQHRLELIAQAAALFYTLLAIETTIETTSLEIEAVDAQAPWRNLADFFSATINDHFYEYRPWIYSRGIGFSAFGEEDLYALALRHHAWLYRYLRFFVTHYTEVKDLPRRERDLLLGNFLDNQEIRALGTGGTSHAEMLWRSYGQLRELAFIRNDGFPLPEVFPHFDIDLIRADQRVNHIIVLPAGRTHYSRALCEGPTLARQLQRQGRPGANLIISQAVDITARPELSRPALQVYSGHLYLDADTYERALIRHKECSPEIAAQRAAAIHPKGIRVAAVFDRPLLGAVVYPFHGHPLYTSGQLEDCGLPYAVQSLFHTWTTYDKTKYPDIFPPESGVDIPTEIDWLAEYTARSSDEARIKKWIENGLPDTPYRGLRPFARDHRIVMVKDASESGGRGAAAFALRKADNAIDDVQLEEAVNFIYQISLEHNVSVQEVIQTSPEYWATEAFMQSFVARQIVELGSPVQRQQHPRTPLFGSHRIILSTDNPAEPDVRKKWHLSHWITLNSKQLITNVGRGGSLEQFLPEYIRAEHRDNILEKLATAGRRVMEALSAYEQRAAPAYQRKSGRPVGTDLTGVSYGMPRYMMLDFLIAPIFAEDGTLVDIQPRWDERGRRVGSTYLLRRGSRHLQGTIVDWRVVLIEPNIGVGLWDRLALREETRERANSDENAMNWDNIGANARVVLSDLTSAGEDYLKALRERNASTF